MPKRVIAGLWTVDGLRRRICWFDGWLKSYPQMTQMAADKEGLSADDADLRR